MIDNTKEDENYNEGVDATPMKFQVAGHTSRNEKSLGLMALDGRFVLKPVLQQHKGQKEIDFYESLREPQNEITKELKMFTPAYFGTREFWTKGRFVKWIVLEDLTKDFVQPCIMDVKIGRQTWDPDATDEKKKSEQLKYVASKRDLGLSVPGFQVFDVLTGELRKYDSVYGKSLDGEGVREAMRIFLNGYTALSRLLLLQFLSKLWQILRWFRKQTQYQIYGSSILLIYDAAKLRDHLSCKMRLRNNGTHRPTVARQLSLRTPTGPLTPGFEPLKRSPTLDSRPSTPASAGSTDDLSDVFDTMCKTHSLENNYEQDLKSMKENYSVVLKDLLQDRVQYESWVNVKMIDFAHVFPSNNLDRNYLDGLENFVLIFEEMLLDAE